MAINVEQKYPPDVALAFEDGHVSFTRIAILLVFALAAVDLLLVGFPETGIPVNYPFFGDVLLLVFAAVLLQRSHAVLRKVCQELVSISRANRNDPLALAPDVDPDDMARELSNVLYLSYHPAVILLGGVLGGGFVFLVMWLLDVFSAYPYLLLDFGFGAAHGAFFGPVIGAFYIFLRAARRYIVDISLLDPDGVGGYRQIGNGIVTLATYGILLVTVDFVILSSVAFTDFSEFKLVVTGLFLLLLCVFVGFTFTSTLIIRRELLDIRDHKIGQMQTLFNRHESAYWRKQQRGDHGLAEAVEILAMYTMFHQMSRMSMWPLNVYSLARLALSVGFSLAVLVIDHIDLLSNAGGLLP